MPTGRKETHIRPFFKLGKDKRQAESYRPISLLGSVAKLLDINRRLLRHLKTNSILAPAQRGYRQIAAQKTIWHNYLTQKIENAFRGKKKVLAVFFDLSKAFDTVWKERLLLKLLKAGVRGKMYN